MSITRIYLAGPMSGLPDNNYPAFHAAAARLRALGYHVENPAENPVPEPETWENYLRMGLRQMLTCDAVVTLPGSPQSRGAVLEMSVARQVGIPVLEFEQMCNAPNNAIRLNIIPSTSMPDDEIMVGTDKGWFRWRV